MMNAPHNPNRSLIRIFCLSLSGLLLVYSLIAVHNLFELKDTNATELAIGVLRIALGLGAVGAVFRWGWFDEPLESQVRLMGASFEAHYAALNTKTKIRSIVLVTMLSLLLELVLIRWVPSYVRMFGYFTNFILMGSLLGAGIGILTHRGGRMRRLLSFPVLLLVLVGFVLLNQYTFDVPTTASRANRYS